MHKKLSRKPKSFGEITKKVLTERKLFFSVLFLVFSVFVFVMGTQVFTPDSTFSKTILNRNRVQTRTVEILHASTFFPVADGRYDSFEAFPVVRDTYTLVDEEKCNGEDYVYSSIYQKMVSFKVDTSKIPDGSKIRQIDIIPCGAHVKQAGTPAAIQTFYRMDGVDSKMISHILPDSVYPTELTVASWKNLNLVKLSGSEFEIGIQNAGGDRGVKVANVKMQIRYVLPTSN